MIKKIQIPYKGKIDNLNIGDRVEISGVIYTARDAVMSKLAKLILTDSFKKIPISLKGTAIMHTAFSTAGYGPTSSNKDDIELNMGLISKEGVKFHLGKGELRYETVKELDKYRSVYVLIPPLTALLQDRLVSKELIAYPEEGVEAMFKLEVKNLPGYIAICNGKSIFHKDDKI